MMAFEVNGCKIDPDKWSEFSGFKSLEKALLGLGFGSTVERLRKDCIAELKNMFRNEAGDLRYFFTTLESNPEGMLDHLGVQVDNIFQPTVI